jgi:hypothetical protein
MVAPFFIGVFVAVERRACRIFSLLQIPIGLLQFCETALLSFTFLQHAEILPQFTSKLDSAP